MMHFSWLYVDVPTWYLRTEMFIVGVLTWYSPTEIFGTPLSLYPAIVS